MRNLMYFPIYWGFGGLNRGPYNFQIVRISVTLSNTLTVNRGRGPNATSTTTNLGCSVSISEVYTTGISLSVVSSDWPEEQWPNMFVTDMTGELSSTSTVLENSITTTTDFMFTDGSAKNLGILLRANSNISLSVTKINIIGTLDGVSTPILQDVNIRNNTIEPILFQNRAFSSIRVELITIGDSAFNVTHDMFGVFIPADQPQLISSDYSNTSNIFDGSATTFASAIARQTSPENNVEFDFGNIASRNSGAAIQASLISGAANFSYQYFTKERAEDEYILASSGPLTDGLRTLVESGSRIHRFARLVINSTSDSPYVASLNVFEVYDLDQVSPTDVTRITIGTSDVENGPLSDVKWSFSLEENDEVYMPAEIVTLMAEKFVTLSIDSLLTGASISLDRLTFWEEHRERIS